VSRAYALVQLLRHGPMRWSELVEVTGWPLDELKAQTASGVACGAIRCITMGRAGNSAYEAARP
jgi:hypothetical protein